MSQCKTVTPQNDSTMQSHVRIQINGMEGDMISQRHVTLSSIEPFDLLTLIGDQRIYPFRLSNKTVHLSSQDFSQ